MASQDSYGRNSNSRIGQYISQLPQTVCAEEPPLETVENSEVLTYLKTLFPSLTWTHYPYNYLGNEQIAPILGQARLKYGVLIGQGKFFHIRVEIVLTGVKAELSFGTSKFGRFTTQGLIVANNKSEGCSLKEALKPIHKCWVEMQAELQE